MKGPARGPRPVFMLAGLRCLRHLACLFARIGLTGRGFGSTADAAGAEWVCVCADLFERAGQRFDVGVGEVL